MDVDTRGELKDALPRGRYEGVAVAADRSAVYYSRQTDQGPRVFRHVMGTDVASLSGRAAEIAGLGGSQARRWATGSRRERAAR